MKASPDTFDPSFGPPVHHLCQCPLCARERKFHRIAAKLTPRDKAWMLGFYDYVVNDLEKDFQKSHATKRKPGSLS